MESSPVNRVVFCERHRRHHLERPGCSVCATHASAIAVANQAARRADRSLCPVRGETDRCHGLLDEAERDGVAAVRFATTAQEMLDGAFGRALFKALR